jgi:hypothetical protein
MDGNRWDSMEKEIETDKNERKEKGIDGNEWE